MKNFKRTLSLAILFSSSCLSVFAQAVVNDSVSISPAYTDQAFYSLQNGTVQTSVNTDWDLAFQISGFQAAILVNSKNNVHLYKANKDITQWSNMVVGDTTGLINSSNELYNEDTTWFNGAFNVTADLANQFDLGWGVYDFNTHIVYGDSIYFIQLSTGDFKKLKIDMLQSETYYFTYANLDGSNEVPATLVKSGYQGKNFGYYSITNANTIDREPNKYTWDICFEQYLSLTPFIYKVAGVLSNDSVQVAKAYPVDVTTVSATGQNFSYHINQIGYDWKTYDFNLNQWTIEDSLVYFVYDRSNVLWKLIFTGFGGSATGTYYFTKQAQPTGINGNATSSAEGIIYTTNPSSSFIHLVYFSDKNAGAAIEIINAEGKVVSQTGIAAHSGLNEWNIPAGSLADGIYFLRVASGNHFYARKVMIRN